MNINNRDEALNAKDKAESLMKKTDFTGARKLAMMANGMDSSLENISHMLMVCDVHCAATEKLFGNEMDWYGILQVELNANDVTIKKQYKRLALLLHPDKNKLPGAEAAFKLIGEAQRILLDREKRTIHDMKRKSWRQPGAAVPLYRNQQGPNYHSQSVNMRNVFNELRPENRHPQQKAQAQPSAFGRGPTFWTKCPYCHSKYEYPREHIMLRITCQICKRLFAALEAVSESVPPANGSRQTTFPIPQQDKFPSQKASNEPQQRPDNPATVSSGKASFPKSGSTAGNNNGKRKRKNMVESSESSGGESSSESEAGNMAAQDLRSNGGQQPRRSVRGKREVSYKENLSDDDDADLGDENEEGSRKNTDTEIEEEPEDEKQTDKDHHSTEALPNGVKPKEKIREDQVETSAGASDSEEDLSSKSEAKPNTIDYDDPDFNDFDKLRDESCFEAGQIWALYDEGEGMPRFYALIRKVKTPKFSIEYTWLEAEEDEENETQNLPVSVGKFELGEKQKTDGTILFSHLVYSKTRKRGRRFKVFPRKGETWALFKNWNMDLSESPREYEYVEILSDHAEGTTVSVGFLCKVEGFSCVFRPMPNDDGSNTCEIPPHEFCRFSHRVPSFRLKGTEGRGVIEGWYELDPAALPVHGSRNVSGEEAAQDQDHQSPPSGSAS